MKQTKKSSHSIFICQTLKLQSLPFDLVIKEDGLTINNLINLEAALDSRGQSKIIAKDLSNGVVGGDDQLLGTDLNSGALLFSSKGIAVGPDLEVMTQALVVGVKVIEQDVGLALIGIPPLVARFEIKVLGRALRARHKALARAGRTHEPNTTNIIKISRGLGKIRLDTLGDTIVQEEDLGIQTF